MGSCNSRATEHTILPRERDPLPQKRTPPVKIFAHPNSAFSIFFRYALTLKSVPFHIVSSNHNSLLFGTNVFSGSRESLLRILDQKFPHPRHPKLVPTSGSLYRKEGSLLVLLLEGETTPLVARMIALQHRSIGLHLERLVQRVEQWMSRGGGKNGKGNSVVRIAKFEINEFDEKLSWLTEILIEHSQIEEHTVFPILQAADKGFNRSVSEEHERHIVILNGIKEVAKMIEMIPEGIRNYQEALANLLSRVKLLERSCKAHFEEEQSDVLPLMEKVNLSEEQQLKMVDRCLDSMKATHSNLLPFLIEGLLPWETMLYLDLIIGCKEESQAVKILNRIAR